jgi:hypothetical protein
MILLLLLARLPRRPRLISGAAIAALGLIAAVVGLVAWAALAVDGAIALLCGLLLLLSTRVDPDRVRARIAALRAR